MRAVSSVVFLASVFASAVGFFLNDDPCDVFPQYQSGIPDTTDFTTTASVPASCRNGTFRWDYPRGHTILKFHNAHEGTISICIRDRLGGSGFSITDTTSSEPLGDFDYKNWACFTPTSSRDIQLMVDAPETLRYMGEFEYKITPN